jgi:hypothetical protein
MVKRTVLTIEKCLAVAHQSVSFAIREASTLSDLGMHDDLQMLQLELERLQYSLLRGKTDHRSFLNPPAYLSSSPRDDGRPTA